MRVLLFGGLLAGICVKGVAQPLRTPDGMLWAGSTFSLRAVATTQDGRPLSVSNQATVTVGEVIRWRVAVESEPALTIPSSEGWFTLLIQNRGNAVDALNLRLKVNESADASPWSVALFEQREDGSGFNSGHLLTDATSPLMPGEDTPSLSARPSAWRPQHRRRVDSLAGSLAKSPVSGFCAQVRLRGRGSALGAYEHIHCAEPSDYRRPYTDSRTAPLAHLGWNAATPLPHAEFA
jgi:hypothetical protein